MNGKEGFYKLGPVAGAGPSTWLLRGIAPTPLATQKCLCNQSPLCFTAWPPHLQSDAAGNGKAVFEFIVELNVENQQLVDPGRMTGRKAVQFRLKGRGGGGGRRIRHTRILSA